MRIRSFQPVSDPTQHIQSWELLRKAITEILNQNNSGLSFEELYRNAYVMVLSKHGDNLYNGLKSTLENHVKQRVLKRLNDSWNDNFLGTLNKLWSEHSIAMHLIRDILMYMDRVYIPNSGHPGIYITGIQTFRKYVLEQSHVADNLSNIILSMVKSERNNEFIDKVALKDACKMLLHMGNSSDRSLYEQLFEKEFLKDTKIYYEHKSQKMLMDNSADLYVENVQEILKKECEFAELYLDKVTEKKLMQDLNEVLVKNHIHTIINMENSGMLYLLKNDMLPQLANMYSLFKNVPTGIENTVKCLSQYVRETGEYYVNSFDKIGEDGQAIITPVKLIENLIGLRDRCENFLINAFHRDEQIKRSLIEDFEYFVNLSRRTPEYLSLYIDDRLKKHLKEQEGDIEAATSKAMILFKYIVDKDMFETYYRKHLSKRLLNSKTALDYSEKHVVDKIKHECGGSFTSKMDGMFQDVEAAQLIQTTYKEYCQNNPSSSGIDLSIKVLKPINWPSSIGEEAVNIPSELTSAFDHFCTFYTHKFKSRKLKLHWGLGTAELKVTFYNKIKNDDKSQLENSTSSVNLGVRKETKILIVPTTHMLMLLEFNKREKLTFKELKDSTKLPEKDLKRALMSVSMGKANQRILTRTVGAGKEIQQTDEFIINDNFTSKFAKIRITNVTGKTEVENENERRKTKEVLETDRKAEIDAAIVRVMKARKTLNHNNLITEVTNVLCKRFRPEILTIKKCIETLIERDFLKRNEKDNKTYEYVA
uniref:CULLIN_2 domain-containing protein n=1 Tax=Strongyloides stercoralis TaxID=6248 RepID=A0A0K0E0R4_STRER